MVAPITTSDVTAERRIRLVGLLRKALQTLASAGCPLELLRQIVF
jgi:hypothetical protein